MMDKIVLGAAAIFNTLDAKSNSETASELTSLRETALAATQYILVSTVDVHLKSATYQFVSA